MQVLVLGSLLGMVDTGCGNELQQPTAIMRVSFIWAHSSLGSRHLAPSILVTLAASRVGQARVNIEDSSAIFRRHRRFYSGILLTMAIWKSLYSIHVVGSTRNVDRVSHERWKSGISKQPSLVLQVKLGLLIHSIPASKLLVEGPATSTQEPLSARRSSCNAM